MVPFGSQAAPPGLSTSPPLATPSPQAIPLAPVPMPSGAIQGRQPSGLLTESQGDGQKQLIPDAAWLRFWLYLCVIVGGAFGGLIYGLSRNRGAVIPHFMRLQDVGGASGFQKLDLGFLGDMLIGIGGGIIVFNLVPQADRDIFESLFLNYSDVGKVASLLMKIMALSLIGGFAGISLFDEAAKRISRELEEVRAQAQANSGLIHQLKSVDALEAQIQSLLNPLIDPSFPPLNESQKEAFKQLLIKAPKNLRNKVFERLQTAFNAHLISSHDIRLSPQEINIRLNLQECLTAGFDALLAAADDYEQKTKEKDVDKHRYLAHKGFIHDQLAIGNELKGLQATQHWLQGEEDLSGAIRLRDEIPADRENYWFYTLERMLCRYKLGKREDVIAEINSQAVERWVHKNRGVISASLKIQPDDFLDFLRSQFKDKPQWAELFVGTGSDLPVSWQPVGQQPLVQQPVEQPGVVQQVAQPGVVQRPTLQNALAQNGNGVTSAVPSVPQEPQPSVSPTVQAGPTTVPQTTLQRIRQGGIL
ncbi:MAG: hypothetical protein ACK41W_01685 [Cyanobacteriota bacterium]